MLQPLMPKVVLVVKKLVYSDCEKAISAMEIWEELLETELSIIAPYLKTVGDMCLEVAADKKLDDAIRVKALHFICTLARLKKKVINFICG